MKRQCALWLSHSSPHTTMLLALSLLLLLAPTRSPAAAQSSRVECGPITVVTDPVDDMRADGDDFALYRARWGGLHVGADVAFYRYGDPVYAVARGRVTYADPEGWDTEHGVVILEHITPDGRIFYSLYGHMEEIANHAFPPVGVCLEAGTIVGAVGDPSLSAPHLHFEIRTFGPDDGGPGYWDTNPLEAGWLHPIDWLRLWQTRLQRANENSPPAALASVTGIHIPTLPPVPLPDGGLIMAAGQMIEGLDQNGALRWRLELSGALDGLIGLGDGRVAVRTADDSVQILGPDGRYVALWRPGVPLDGGPYRVGDVIAVLSDDHRLLAYAPDGTLRWQSPPLGARVTQVISGPDRIAVNAQPANDDATTTTRRDWIALSANGQELYRLAPQTTPVAAFAPDGTLYLIDGTTLFRVTPDGEASVIATLPRTAGRTSALHADAAGAVIFLAGREPTLTAYAPDGSPRWETALPGTHAQPPLLASSDNCLFYALANDGTLHVLRAADGVALTTAGLYAGGRSSQPGARLLAVGPGGRVTFGAGFLSVVTLDGYALAGVDATTCPAAGIP